MFPQSPMDCTATLQLCFWRFGDPQPSPSKSQWILDGAFLSDTEPPFPRLGSVEDKHLPPGQSPARREWKLGTTDPWMLGTLKSLGCTSFQAWQLLVRGQAGCRNVTGPRFAGALGRAFHALGLLRGIT